MSLSLEEFTENCKQIAELSKRFPGCEWRLKSDQDGQLQFVAHSTASLLEDGESCTFQYHIVYSQSYNVPVLYFNAWLRDGRLMRLKEVWDQIAKLDENSVTMDPWSVLTQQEHPYLHQPWFMIHPCKTKDMMQKLLDQNSCKPLKNYVLSWLSSVAHLTGLQRPLEFADESAESGS